jgi:acyl-coenzyme A synthetase/AMP-(fatty) acid ligase
MTESLADAFAARAARDPAAPALLWAGSTVTYGELDALRARAAAGLAELGLDPGVPVGILGKKSPEAIALVLACLGDRRPFLLPSIELAPDTLDALFAQAGASHVLSPSTGGGEAPLVARPVERAGGDGDGPGLPASAEGPEGVAFMLTTSGSTGLPKIVPLSPAGVWRFTDWAAAQFGIGPGTTVLNYAPLNFDLCLLDIWSTLKAGGCVAMVDQDRGTNGAYLVDLLAANEVNVIQAVPMLYRLLIDATREDGTRFPAAAHVMSTGDKIPASSLEQLPELFPNARFFNIYGCTETNDSLMYEFDLTGGAPVNIPVGSPLPGVIALMVSPEGEFVEGAGTGELVVWTPFQTRGYLTAELNAGKFVTYPDGDGDGYGDGGGDADGGGGEKIFFRTGDIVRRHDDGSMTLEGRADFYVKVRGVRVSTQVVEQAIMEHPEVIEVAVVAVPDELAGSRLHALVRKEEGGKLNSLKLRQHCAGRLARTEMPSSIEVVTEPLPKTPTGKIDRKRCLPRQERTTSKNG